MQGCQHTTHLFLGVAGLALLSPCNTRLFRYHCRTAGQDHNTDGCTDCCRTGDLCLCGSCFTPGEQPPRCKLLRPARDASCCGDAASECTLCNKDCCLGTDQCSCKGACIAEGDPEPECGPGDLTPAGDPKKTCCDGRAAEQRCNGRRTAPPEPCRADCCPEGMFCSGCGRCEPEGTQPPLCGFPPGVQVSCCDDVDNTCTRCNEDCCLGSATCSCKGTCVEEGEDMPECGPEDYFDFNGLPKQNCCQGAAGAERCAVVKRAK